VATAALPCLESVSLIDVRADGRDCAKFIKQHSGLRAVDLTRCRLDDFSEYDRCISALRTLCRLDSVRLEEVQVQSGVVRYTDIAFDRPGVVVARSSEGVYTGGGNHGPDNCVAQPLVCEDAILAFHGRASVAEHLRILSDQRDHLRAGPGA